ncbi:hypothetical protein V1634_24650 [Plantactinospora veratri]|uniref:Peptidase MA-like domain-containing protein n=1 Tax=Plantactinospora veratri TaxID=1436122 RepID=A0ABU7SJ89_9ACTN
MGGTSPQGGGRRSYGLWLAVGAAVLVVLLVGAAAVVVGGGGDDPVVADQPSASASPEASVHPAQRLEQMLRAQGEALLRGDEQGWLAPIDPGNRKLYEYYRGQFTVLRALKVSAWQVRMGIPPIVVLGRETEARMMVAYCFGTPKCPEFKQLHGEAAQFTQDLTVRWGEDGTILVTGSKAAERDRFEARPLPWESERLTVREGRRVIVAAPAGQLSRLGEVVAAADRAAPVVDRYARLAGREPPTHYIVFTAGETEWNAWRGGKKGKWVSGYAYRVGLMTSNVVIRMSRVDRDYLETILRHEFGHVVTATGSDPYGTSVFDKWLVEGIAEYIGRSGEPASRTPRMHSIRTYVRQKGWPRTIKLPSLDVEAEGVEVDAFYGLNYLTMSCLAKRHGEPKLFRWWIDVVHGEVDDDQATRKHFGESWAAMERACLSYIRSTV